MEELKWKPLLKFRTSGLSEKGLTTLLTGEAHSSYKLQF